MNKKCSDLRGIEILIGVRKGTEILETGTIYLKKKRIGSCGSSGKEGLAGFIKNIKLAKRPQRNN
jgi:hypothetical protein